MSQKPFKPVNRKANLAFLFLAVLLTAYSITFFQSSIQFEDECEEEYEEKEESGADKQLSMWFHAKAYPEPYNLDQKYANAWQQHLELKNSSMLRSDGIESASWSSLGQSRNTSGGLIGGRILCLAIDPNNPNNLWAGSASGGIWRSTNQGTSWSPVITNLNVLGVTSILIDPTNSNVIYAGTGEMYNTEVDVMGHNVWKTRGTYGIGIIKSTNGGTSWTQVMTKNNSDLFTIQTMKFDPTNSNTIYACASDGLYRSTNNGSTWNQVLTKIYVKDIAINPSNTDQQVVSIGNMLNSDKGIYRTTNGNLASPTWTKITSGLPSTFDGSIKLDNVGSGNLVASIGISSSGTPNEVYRSTDFGATWSVRSSTNHCSYQFWFAHTIAINPFDTDSIMFGGVGIYRYRISNSTRTTISGLHSDHHYIKYDPSQRGRIYVCNDGGIYKSTNGGSSFSLINNGLNATQFYASLGVSSTNMNRMVGGLQDNGQVIYNGTTWDATTVGGDGTACAIDPDNDQNILISRDARAVYKSANGGSTWSQRANYWGFAADSRTGFAAPLAYSRSNSSIIYLASDNLHKSTDGAITNFSDNAYSTATNYIDAQRKTAIALAVSPTNSNKVYVSISPFAQADNDNNTIYVTGTTNVMKTLTGNTPFTSIKGSLPDRFVMDFAISPTNDDSVFVALGGFGTPHIYVTGNGGSTWTARSTGLPDVPFNALVFDPLNSNIIYAGSDFGVYVSPDRGATWMDYNNGFWDATLVMDLQISADNMLVAATHGKGVFKSALFTGTLPVSVTSFTGYHQSGKNILEWIVQGEYNIHQYEIEKSTDRVNFSRIGSRNATNAPGMHGYNYTDLLSNNQAGVYYYRLKIVETDGTFSYSRVLMLQPGGTKNFHVLNNPFTLEIRISMNVQQSTTVNLGLYDMSGKTVKRKTLNAAAGPNMFVIDGMDFLSKGVYIIEATAGKERYSSKLVKN